MGLAVRIFTTLLLCTGLLCTGLLGCDAKRRADRSAPIPRHLIAHQTPAPVKLYTSRVDSLPPGRPSTVTIEVVADRALVGIGSAFSGHDGLLVTGGKRLNHGAAGRGRVIKRFLMVEAQPGSSGHLHVEIAWKPDLQTVERRATVEIPLAARAREP